jgi:hypothetical protein
MVGDLAQLGFCDARQLRLVQEEDRAVTYLNLIIVKDGVTRKIQPGTTGCEN